MRYARLFARQVRYENRAFWRNPAAAFFTFAFPLIFLIIFNLVFGDGDIETPRGTISSSTFYVPAIVAFAVINANYSGLATSISFARDEGQLKRIRGTPLPAWIYLSARAAHLTLVGLLLVVIVMAFGRTFYDVEIPGKTLPAFIVSVAVGAAAFAMLGLAISGFISNAEAAPAVVNATILPLLFISDVFIPLEDAPQWLHTVGDFFPVKHFAESLHTAYSPFETGSGFEPLDLLVVAAWGIAGAVVAFRKFSWEPRR